MKSILLFMLLIAVTAVSATPSDTVKTVPADSVVQMKEERGEREEESREMKDERAKTKEGRGIFPAILRGLRNFINEFNTYDTLYIEPQHYKFQAMCQLTNTYEQFRLRTPEDSQIFLSPEVRTTVGPYVGYSLLFLGYTLQLNNLYIGNAKKSFNLSLYSSIIGIDLHYHNNNSFKIHTITHDDTEIEVNAYTDALNVKRWGFNTYYIFNHRRLSYPAAYNQSTCQRRSAGSPLAGIGYSDYDLNISWDKINQTARTANATPQHIQYQAYSAYGGYAYNWVFARNLLLGVSATLTLSYNKTKGEQLRMHHIFRDFKMRNLSVDGLGRLGIVWNNTRFFAGASAQIHSYTYSKHHLSINNTFGNFNIYAGINFGKKKPYRTPGKLFEF